MTSALDNTVVLPTDEGPELLPATRRPPSRAVLALILGIAALLVVVLITAEWIVRSEVEHLVGAEVTRAAEFPSTQLVDVAIAGPVLPQMLLHSFAEVTVSADNVEVGPLGFDVILTATDVSFYDGTSGSIHGELSMGAAQVAGALAQQGLGEVDVSFLGSDLVVAKRFEMAGSTVSVGFTAKPAFDAGCMSMTMTSMMVADKTLSVADAAEMLGPEAAAALQPTSTCFADALPVGAKITGVSVRGQAIVMQFDIAPRSAPDEDLIAIGSARDLGFATSVSPSASE